MPKPSANAKAGANAIANAKSKAVGSSTEVEHAPAAITPRQRAMDLAEEQELTRVVESSMIDPTERDYLLGKPRAAARRVGRAWTELMLSLGALMVALLARLVLADAIRAVVQERGEIPGAELTARAFERILGGFFYRKVLRQRNVMRMFGATCSETYEGDIVYGLALARRAYGGSYPGGVEEPRVRAAIGVRLMPGEAPVWMVKRFFEAEPGTWRREPLVARHGCAEAALLDFYKDVPAEKLGRTLAEELVGRDGGCKVSAVADILKGPGGSDRTILEAGYDPENSGTEAA